MKLKSTLSLLCVTGLMAMALAGCGSSSAGASNAPSAASKSVSTSASSEPSSSEIIGQVQSVSDKTVTLLLGDLTDAGQNQNGVPAQPAGSSSSGANLNAQAPSGSQPSTSSQQPSGGQSSSQQPSGQPDGKQPDVGQPGGAQNFTAGTETKTITLTDDTVIKVENVTGETVGSIADIKEGAVLDATLGDNNTATTVIIKNIMADSSAAPISSGVSMPATSSSGSQSAKG